MIALLPIRSASRKLRFLSLGFSFLLLCGCGDEGYPEAMRYPRRTDALINEQQMPKRDAPDIDRPGEFPNMLFAGLTTEERSPILLDPAKVNAEQREVLDKLLLDTFGTPAKPTVAGSQFQQLSDQLKLDDATLARGSRLYREQCLHCHGLSGDGRGSTAPWINPHPRDYRAGKFKFVSTAQVSRQQQKPSKEDLIRTIRTGIEGTSMPSFRLYSEEELQAVASYVIHLSLRGQTEYLLLLALLDTPSTKVKDEADGMLETLADWWGSASKNQIKPDPATLPKYPLPPEELKASARRGFQLFVNPGAASCISCHSDFGRQSAYKYDIWGTIVRPIDLTAGVYRGGRRPIDLYWRIAAGINVSGMTSYKNQLKDQDIWDLVHFLQVLPYPQMRKEFGIRLELPEDNAQDKVVAGD